MDIKYIRTQASAAVESDLGRLLDWFARLYDASDVERFLHCWVVPRLGRDVWLEDVDVHGPQDWWLEVLSIQVAGQLCDMLAVCKDRCKLSPDPPRWFVSRQVLRCGS